MTRSPNGSIRLFAVPAIALSCVKCQQFFFITGDQRKVTEKNSHDVYNFIVS
jgi:hypothetical protein